MTFQEYQKKSRLLIQENLQGYLGLKKTEDLPLIFKEQGLIEAVESFALRGKLIRGSLFLLGCEMLGGKIEKEHLDIACAIELMHSSLLMQDDVIDRDYMRRGAKTIFAKYKDEGEKIGAFDPYHYGISSAIVAADIAFFLAFDLLSNFSNSSLGILLKYYAHEAYLVTLAEGADSLFGLTKKEPNKEEIYAVYKYKTARYTFSLPFEMATIVSDAPPTVREALNALGELSGMIFQLKDDELGLFGDESTIGKPVGSDIRENKKTIIRLMLFEHANEEDRKILANCFGNPNAGEEQVNIVRELYNKYNVSDYVRVETQEIMDKVWEIYEELEVNDEYKNILKGLLEFNLSRTA
jgi:geranylgeranyl diphosphate synthase type I